MPWQYTALLDSTASLEDLGSRNEELAAANDMLDTLLGQKDAEIARLRAAVSGDDGSGGGGGDCGGGDCGGGDGGGGDGAKLREAMEALDRLRSQNADLKGTLREFAELSQEKMQALERKFDGAVIRVKSVPRRQRLRANESPRSASTLACPDIPPKPIPVF